MRAQRYPGATPRVSKETLPCTTPFTHFPPRPLLRRSRLLRHSPLAIFPYQPPRMSRHVPKCPVFSIRFPRPHLFGIDKIDGPHRELYHRDAIAQTKNGRESAIEAVVTSYENTVVAARICRTAIVRPWNSIPSPRCSPRANANVCPEFHGKNTHSRWLAGVAGNLDIFILASIVRHLNRPGKFRPITHQSQEHEHGD